MGIVEPRVALRDQHTGSARTHRLHARGLQHGRRFEGRVQRADLRPRGERLLALPQRIVAKLQDLLGLLHPAFERFPHHVAVRHQSSPVDDG